jgi:hypothetical protein
MSTMDKWWFIYACAVSFRRRQLMKGESHIGMTALSSSQNQSLF